MTERIMYAIQHEPTGHYMPRPRGHSGRGSSLRETEDCRSPLSPIPHLMHSEATAKRVLAAWLRGKHHPEYDEGCVYVGSIEAIPTRKADEMVIVPVILSIP